MENKKRVITTATVASSAALQLLAEFPEEVCSQGQGLAFSLYLPINLCSLVISYQGGNSSTFDIYSWTPINYRAINDTGDLYIRGPAAQACREPVMAAYTELLYYSSKPNNTDYFNYVDKYTGSIMCWHKQRIGSDACACVNPISPNTIQLNPIAYNGTKRPSSSTTTCNNNKETLLLCYSGWYKDRKEYNKEAKALTAVLVHEATHCKHFDGIKGFLRNLPWINRLSINGDEW